MAGWVGCPGVLFAEGAWVKGRDGQCFWQWSRCLQMLSGCIRKDSRNLVDRRFYLAGSGLDVAGVPGTLWPHRNGGIADCGPWRAVANSFPFGSHRDSYAMKRMSTINWGVPWWGLANIVVPLFRVDR